MKDETQIIIDEREGANGKERFFILHPSSFILRLTVLLLFVLWSATHLDGFSWDYDEGIHVYTAWLVQQGHPLYAQTFSAYTPGFIAALVAAFNLSGATVFVARLVTVVFAALGMLGVMLIAGELVASPSPVQRGRGWGGGHILAELAAAALLALAPSFFQWSRAAMSDLPSASLTALAVALALIYARDQRLRWLFAAEGVLAAALWVKLIAIGGAVAIVFAVILTLRVRRTDVRRAVLGSLLIGLLALWPLLFVDVRAMYEQAIYFHVQKRTAFAQTPIENFQTLLEFLGSNLTLVSLATLGAIRATRHVRSTSRAQHVTSLWFAATFISLTFQVPLFANHHPVILAFSLAALAGASVSFIISDLYALKKNFTLSPCHPVILRRAQDRLLSPRHLVTLSALLVSFSGLAQYPDQLRAAAAPPFQPVAEEATTLLRALTSADELVVSDAQMIAFRAKRQSPPPLSDTSQARLVSSNLTAEQLIAIAQQSNANGILFWSGRLASLPTFVDWAERNYHPVKSSFQKPNSPYRLLVREPHPQYPLEAQIGDGIRLWGYDLNRRENFPVELGRAISLTLYFQRTGLVEKSYTVFTHLLGPDGRLVSQEDRPPLAGRYSTDQWKADELIADEFVMPLPAGAASCECTYHIEVGMYLRETLQRLPVRVQGVPQPDDRLLLRTIGVRSNQPTN